MDLRGAVRHILDAYVVAPFSYVPTGLRVPLDHDLIVGRGTRIDGAIEGGGRVILANQTILKGPVRARSDLVAGARSVLEGPIDVRGDAVLLQGVKVTASVRVAGDARILGAWVSGPLHAGGDIEVRPPAVISGQVSCAGRVRTVDAEAVPASVYHPPPSNVILEPL